MQHLPCVSRSSWRPQGWHTFGTPATKATKQARIAAHAVFDQLWKGGGMSRGDAYRWLCEAMGLTPEECHIGRFDEAQCNRVIRLVWARDPDEE